MKKRIMKTPKESTPKTFGMLAKFETQEALLDAVNRVYTVGLRHFDAYAPYPVEGLSQAMHLKPSPMPYVILAGGVLGGLTGFLMQTFATVIDYPLNIGGKGLFSWPAYIPITFELTILVAAFAGILGLFYLTRFPQPYHPVFNSEDFNAHASQDGFYLGIEASDPMYNAQQIRALLESTGSSLVTEIPE